MSENKYIILFISMLTVSSAICQNISGLWEGYLDQSEGASKIEGYKIYWEKGIWKKGEKTHNLKLTFNYNKKKKRYEGEYFISNRINKAHYAKFKIKASVQNNKVTYNTIEKLFETQNSINTSYCYSTSNLKYSEDSNYEYLKGEWTGWSRNSKPCADAYVWLRKKKKIREVEEEKNEIAEKIEKDTFTIIETVEIDTSEVDTPTNEIVISEIKDTIIKEDKSENSSRRINIKDRVQLKKDSITIKIWDYNQKDGDIVTLYLNDIVILEKYELEKTFKILRVPLKKGKNILTLFAHNLGSIPPNTAEIHIEREEGFRKIILESDAFSSGAIEINNQ